MGRTIAFIGAGNMGGALIRSVSKTIGAQQVIAYDLDKSRLKVLSQECGCIAAAGSDEAVRSAKFVVICVKPQQFKKVTEELLPSLRAAIDAGEDKVIVSIAAGIKIATITSILEGLPAKIPVVRIMPNTPAQIGEGLLLIAPGEGITESIYKEITSLFKDCGLLERTTEYYLEIASPVSGCSPAFAYIFIEALADGAVQVGLPREKAQLYAAAALKGAAAMVMKTGKHPGLLKDEVCSAGGSTIAGVAELEKRAFRAAAAQAIIAAYERTMQLG